MNKSTILLALFSLFLTSCQKENTEPKTLDLSAAKIIDLSHSYSKETVYWVTAKEFQLDTVFEGQTDKGYYYSAYNFATAEHGGTHIDAPIHFAEGKQTVDEVPVNRLIGKAIKIDVSANAKDNRDYLISIDDLKAWEEKHQMEIPENSIILLYTGFSEYYPNPVKYMGTALRGANAVQFLHFPGLHPDAANWLIKNRTINAIGIDTPSIDYGQSQYFKTHVALMTNDIPAFENLTNLDQLPEKDLILWLYP